MASSFPTMKLDREREREKQQGLTIIDRLSTNAMYIQKADRVGDHAKETDTHIRVFFFLFFAMESFRSSNSSAVEMMSDFFCLLGIFRGRPRIVTAHLIYMALMDMCCWWGARKKHFHECVQQFVGSENDPFGKRAQSTTLRSSRLICCCSYLLYRSSKSVLNIHQSTI